MQVRDVIKELESDGWRPGNIYKQAQLRGKR